ncbi:MAG: 4Fe-4S binding protein [Clostridium sp.]|nr:4Fe-4S binding protein [Clostridium sp.]
MNILKKFWKKYAYTLLIAFIIGGLFDIRVALIAILCMVGPILFALLGKGRFWCGNICPRGNFYDNILKKFSKNKPTDRLLRSSIFRGIIILFMFYMFGTGISRNWGNIRGIGMVFYRMIIATTFVGVVLSQFFNQRTWCSFCPMGSISALISKFKKNKKALVVSSSCVSCKLCERKCPMGIVPHEYKGDILKHEDCIQCGECANVCPKDAINM